jgi:hypothetical protein
MQEASRGSQSGSRASRQRIESTLWLQEFWSSILPREHQAVGTRKFASDRDVPAPQDRFTQTFLPKRKLLKLQRGWDGLSVLDVRPNLAIKIVIEKALANKGACQTESRLGHAAGFVPKGVMSCLSSSIRRPSSLCMKLWVAFDSLLGRPVFQDLSATAGGLTMILLVREWILTIRQLAKSSPDLFV